MTRDMLYRKDRVRLTVCVCYSWEVVFNVGLNASFSNMKRSVGGNEVNSEKSYVRSIEAFLLILSGVLHKFTYKVRKEVSCG
jgi:hypothetical protein